MRSFKQSYVWAICLTLISGLIYIGSCTHKDEILSSNGLKIVRGTDTYTMGVDNWKNDKLHSNVGWESAYMGGAAMLTGRFNQFGVTSLTFDEANPANTSFEGWVRLNTVNTSEPARDGGCLLSTFGTTATLVDETANLATIKSTKIELSTTDKGYIVTANLTFHGVTKQVTGKLSYVPKVHIDASGTAPAYDVFGLTFTFQILAKTDFAIVSSSVADAVKITVNLNFNNR